MEIEVSTLTKAQYLGTACVVDNSHVFQPTDHRATVGYLGDDMHEVYACQTPCAGQLSRLVMPRPRHALKASPKRARQAS